MEEQIRMPQGGFDQIDNQGAYIEAAIQSIVMLNNKFTETNKNITELGQNIKFTAGEISTFKEALCDIGKEMNNSSNKLLQSSKFYFWGSLILSALIAFAALTQAKIINLEKNNKLITIPQSDVTHKNET